MISRSKGYLGRLFGSLRPTILEYLGCGFTTRGTGDDLNHIGVHWLHTFLGFIFRGDWTPLGPGTDRGGH